MRAVTKDAVPTCRIAKISFWSKPNLRIKSVYFGIKLEILVHHKI